MFKWNNKYSVNNDVIDNQHKQLFNIGNEIVETMKDSSLDKYDRIITLVDKLYEYTIFHFESEKKMIEEKGFKLSENHIKEHEDFVYKLYDLKSNDIDENQNQVLIDTLDFVSQWIVNHILNTDREYISIL